MRIYIKGGPWKNSEDEILKSAVMKYGKNQWDRIASLLPRKSAKQCKARWYEWLDPSIRKTDWTREEEEKLLHLVKIMPTQWRTIAPIVGRTPYQCIEHFEYLLDKYQQRDFDYDPTQDPRKLRPGEVDGHAEHKPALPDAIDMDEDEKEMISEAKARMANTMGKKARRRARERQLENQRRLAMLKKRRELKAAGIYVIESRVRKKKRIKNQFKKIDFLTEIPWQKKAPVGYHGVEAERSIGSVEVSPERNLKEIEGRIREIEELKQRTIDKKRIEDREKSDLPTVIKKIQKFHGKTGEEEKRVRFNLPEPQITDDDLHTLSKVGFVPDNEDDSGKATNRLLSTYSTTPAPSGFMMKPNSASSTPTPFQTSGQIRTPYVKDTLAEQMRQVQSLRNTQTPLMAPGDQTPKDPSEFDFLKKKKRANVHKPGETPNPFKAQLSVRPHSSVRQTPFRDEMGINPEQQNMTPGFEDDEGLVRATRSSRRRAERERMRKRREELRKRFQMNLPAPQSEEYLIKQVSSEDNELMDDEGDVNMEDQEELMFRKKQNERNLMRKLMRRRTQVSQRVATPRQKRSYPHQLPIPRPPPFAHPVPPPDVRDGAMVGRAKVLVGMEMRKLVTEDNQFFSKSQQQQPKKKKRRKKKKKSPPPQELLRSDYEGTYVMEFDEDELDDASNLIEKELKKTTTTSSWTDDEFGQSWNRVMNEEEVFFSLPNNFEENFELKKKEVEKLEERNEILTKGYEKVFGDLRLKISTLSSEIEEDERKLESFMALNEIEDFAVPKRINEMKERIKMKKEREGILQDEFNDLKKECEEF